MVANMEDYVCGVDLGGTHLRAVLSDRKGNFSAKRQEETEKKGEAAISEQIVKMVEALCKEAGVDASDLLGIGIATTGPMDLKEGALINPTNLPFEFVPLRDPINEMLKIPVELLNDSTAAVMGEKRFGAGKDLDNLVYVTISTGIGGGAIVDNHLLLGKDGNAAEIGHVVIDPDGRLECGCGKRGHWEAYCSGKNMPNFVRMRLKEIGGKRTKNSILLKSVQNDLLKLNSKILFESAKAGDSLSLELVQEIGKLNAIGFADLTNIFDPSLITVGGSVALKNRELVMSPIRRHLTDYIRNRAPRVMITPLGENVGLYGAVAMVFEAL